MLIVVGTCWPCLAPMIGITRWLYVDCCRYMLAGLASMIGITQWLYVDCCRYVLAMFSFYEWLCYMLLVVGTCWPGSAPMSGITMLIVVGTCWPGLAPMSGITQRLYCDCCRYVLARFSPYEWYNPEVIL